MLNQPVFRAIVFAFVILEVAQAHELRIAAERGLSLTQRAGAEESPPARFKNTASNQVFAGRPAHPWPPANSAPGKWPF